MFSLGKETVLSEFQQIVIQLGDEADEERGGAARR